MTRRIRSKGICKFSYASDCRKRVKGKGLLESFFPLFYTRLSKKKVAIRRKLPNFFLHRQPCDVKRKCPFDSDPISVAEELDLCKPGIEWRRQKGKERKLVQIEEGLE